MKIALYRTEADTYYAVANGVLVYMHGRGGVINPNINADFIRQLVAGAVLTGKTAYFEPLGEREPFSHVSRTYRTLDELLMSRDPVYVGEI